MSALKTAQSLQVAHLGELDNTTSFEKLKRFGQDAFQSPRDVRAFRDQLKQHPEEFDDLKIWHADASKKSAWAHQRMLDDPFERTPVLPAPPADFTNLPAGDLHGRDVDDRMFARFANTTTSINDNEQMYHAASQRGPVMQAWLKQHTPPKPLWQQQLEDGIGRFAVGMVPGVNLLTDEIVPAKSLSPAWRQGIDLLSGVAGGMAGEGGPELIGGLSSRLGRRAAVAEDARANRRPSGNEARRPATDDAMVSASPVPPADVPATSATRPLAGAEGSARQSARDPLAAV